MDHIHETERARRTFVGGAVVAIAGLLAALALVYTNSSGVAEVAAEAQLQQQVESALGAGAAARNTLGQTMLLAGAANDPALAGAAIVDARSVLEAFQARVEAVADQLEDPTTLLGDMSVVAQATNAVLGAVASGDLERAGTIATEDAADAFTEIVEELSALRDDLAVSIASAAAESGRVATASRFMVAFLVPTIAVIVALFVTRRRRKREQLATELAQERSLNKSKDQLIANLSHELRTPLTGIYTSALAIEEVGFEDPDLAMELTDVIIDQSADLTRMVEDLLVSAQADAGRLRFDVRPTQVTEITAGLEKEFARFPVDITWDVVEGEVMVDGGRLRQLLRNLVSNAAKYGGGTVEVTGRSVHQMYVVDVADNGPGVPPEVEERMFERFIHRGDQPLIVGSVGLGLAITKVLAHGMDGLITYHRRDGRTIFEVALRSTSQPDVVPEDPEPSQEPVLVPEEDVVEAH